jgi:hypothetical protein
VRDAKHGSFPRRRVRAGEIRGEDFLYELKAGPAGGLRPPSGPATTRQSPATGLTLHSRWGSTVFCLHNSGIAAGYLGLITRLLAETPNLINPGHEPFGAVKQFTVLG